MDAVSARGSVIRQSAKSGVRILFSRFIIARTHSPATAFLFQSARFLLPLQQGPSHKPTIPTGRNSPMSDMTREATRFEFDHSSVEANGAPASSAPSQPVVGRHQRMNDTTSGTNIELDCSSVGACSEYDDNVRVIPPHKTEDIVNGRANENPTTTKQGVRFAIKSFVLGIPDRGFPLAKKMHDVCNRKQQKSKFFSKGTGDLQPFIRRRDAFYEATKQGKSLSDPLGDDHIQWFDVEEHGAVTVQEARFQSPVADLLPPESKMGRFHLVKPVESGTETYAVMLAATGEMGKSRRLELAKKLATKHGWSSIIVTTPFYGVRKPKEQYSFFIDTIADQLLQSQGVVEEVSLLTEYLLRKSKDSRVCLTGFSFGGGCAFAAAGAALCFMKEEQSRRLACAPFAPCTTLQVFTDGMLEVCVDWQALKQQPETSKFTTKNEFRELVREVELHPKLMRGDRTNIPKIGVVRVYACKSDRFVQMHYSEQMWDNLLLYMPNRGNMSIKYIPGGHVVGSRRQLHFQYRLVTETLSLLDEL